MRTLAHLRSGLVLILIWGLVPFGELGAKERARTGDDAVALESDPAIRRMASLANGMRYLIQPHSVPAKGVTLLLRVDVGSIHEEEHERGFAHFVEHMAFNGTRHFPPGAANKYFDSIGMTPGLHRNAFTYFGQTEYILSLPEANTESLRRGLLFLSDVASAITFDPVEVAQERSVILAEQRSRSDLEWRLVEKSLPYLMRGTRAARRFPIGDLDLVRGATAAALRAFHRKWYRPERMTLIAVGNVTVQTLEPLVRRAFQSMPATSGQPAPLFPPDAPPAPPDVGIITDPDEGYADISIYTVRPSHPVRTRGAYRRSFIASMARTIFDARLARMLQGPGSTLGGSFVQQIDFVPGYVHELCDGRASAAGWKEAVRKLVLAMRRMQTYGVLDGELERARTSASKWYKNPSPRNAAALAAARSDEIRRRWAHLSPAQQRAHLARILPGISKADVNAAFGRIFDLAKLKLLIRLPPAQKDFTLPSEDDLRAVWQSALAVPIGHAPEPLQVKALDQLLDKRPSPGKVVARSNNASLGVTTLKLGNGAVVHVKRLPNSKPIWVFARLSGGRIEEDDAHRSLTDMAAVAFGPGSMATPRFSSRQIDGWLEKHGIQFTGKSTPSGIDLDMVTSSEELEEGLGLMHLLLTQARVSAASLDTMRRIYLAELWKFRSSIRAMGDYWLDWLMSGGDHRLWAPDWEALKAATPSRVQAWVDHMIQTAPLEIGFIGDIDAARAEELALRWFGSLPAREDRTPALRALCKVTGAAGPLRQSWSVDTAGPAAAVLLAWRGPIERDEASFASLSQFAMILSARLGQTLREEQGLTYAIRATYDDSEYDGMRRIAIRFTTSPDGAVKAARRAQEVAQELATEGPTVSELQTTQKRLRGLIERGRSMPRTWRVSLGSLRLHGRTLDDVQARLKAWVKADADQMMRLARETIRDKHLFQVIAVPK